MQPYTACVFVCVFVTRRILLLVMSDVQDETCRRVNPLLAGRKRLAGGDREFMRRKSTCSRAK